MNTITEKSKIKNPKSKISPRSWFRLALLLVLLVVFFFLNYRMMTQVDYPNTDFAAFWAGGRVLVQGHNPYNTEAIQAVYQEISRTRQDELIRAFAYPLPTAFIFAPFGLLPLDWAVTAWAIFNEACFCLTFWLITSTLLRGLKGKERLRQQNFLLLGGLLLFVPSGHFVKTLFNGQTSFLTTFLVALFIYAASRERYALAGLSLVVGLLKPTPFVLFLPVALLWLLLDKRWRGIYAFASGMGGLTLFSLLLNPGWVGQWLGTRTEQGWKTVAEVATAWGLAGGLAKLWEAPALFPALGAVVALLVVVGSWLWWRKSPTLQSSPVLAWGLLATLSIYVTLYAYSYESALLLIPLLGILNVIYPYPKFWRNLALAVLALLLIYLPWQLNGLKYPVDEISAGLYPLTIILFIWTLAAFTPRQIKETRNNDASITQS